MIELSSETENDGHILVCRSSGLVTDKDVNDFLTLIEPAFLLEKPLRLLMDWTALEGYAEGARATETWFGIHHWGLIQRIAVVCEPAWESEVARVRDTCKAGTVRRFAPSDRQAALQWLHEH